MGKRTRFFLLLVLASSIACAGTRPKPPTPYVPANIYMILYGGKFRAYPWAKNSLSKEHEVETGEVVGGMCLKIEDWEAREAYIMDLEHLAGVR